MRLVALVLLAFAFAPAAAFAQQPGPDVQAPEYAIGGLRDPAQGVLVLTVEARDLGGSGLLVATASLGGGAPVAAPFGDETCNAGATAACPQIGTVELEVPTTSLPDGQHDLDLRVSDAAGNVTAKVERIITVRNALDNFTSTVTVRVGSGAETPGAGAGGRPSAPASPLAAPTCQSPRLTMALTRKPLRRQRNGVPVLQAGKSYRFSGRLTCLSGKRRINAPRGVTIDVFHHFGRKVSRKPSAKTAANGRVAVNMRVYAKRVLVFRVTGTRRELVQVRIRVAVFRIKR